MLNIAKACGRKGTDRARQLRIAKGSLLELDAALTLLEHRTPCSQRRGNGRKT